MDNLTRVRTRLQELDVPALVVIDIANVGWMTGFTGSSAWVVVTPDGGAFLTDGRYDIQAREQVPDLPVRICVTPKTMTDILGEVATEFGLREIGFEKSITYDTWETWTEKVPHVVWKPLAEPIAALRMVKTSHEVQRIRDACAIADACFAHVQRMIQPGVAEYDIGLDIEFFIRRQGAAVAFEPIVASGPNSARPHARPTERKLQVGDFVTLDFGATVQGYSSDITRTVVVGKASERHEEVYGAVLEAQLAALDAIEPGGNGKDVDAAARDTLGRHGLAEYFTHSLGHGLGRAVHDFGRLGPNADQPLEAGQVWTVEPGVYIEGFGGVRIEDDVVVTEDGVEILTTSPKELMVLP